MKILLLGKNGQVGWELLRTLSPLGELVAPARVDLDLTNLIQLRAAIRAVKPVLIVNAAAYTDVNKAEEEEKIAYRVNAEAVEVMAEEAEKLNAAIIHYSTDYIFDGEKERPYVEEDKPNPINAYGRTKLAGENALRQSQVPYLIFRSSWIYGLRGRNFLLTILRLAREREILKIVNDQKGAPTWCKFIADSTAEILAKGISDMSGYIAQYKGVYNLTAAGSTTWFGFARMITELDPRRHEQICQHIVPVTTEEYHAPARRPKCSILYNQKVEKTFNLKTLRWDVMFKEMLRGYYCSNQEF